MEHNKKDEIFFLKVRFSFEVTHLMLIFEGNELIYVCLHCSYQLKQHSKLLIHVEKYHKNEEKSEIEKLLEDPSSDVSEVRGHP